MKDLIEFQRLQILKLHEEVAYLRKNNTSLKEYIFEIADNDCPNDYKRIIAKTLIYE